ncbi:MAG: M36 family metallopeptidase, partial [Bacteroidota bacterium]
MNKNFTYLLLLLLAVATADVSAQDGGKLALDYLQKEYAAFGLELTDVANLEVTDNYASPNGTQHVYVAQRVHGLPILNAAAALHFRGNRMVYRTSDLATNLAAVPYPAPAFSAQIAATKAVKAVTTGFGTPVATGTDEDGNTTFSWEAVSPEAVKTKLLYYVAEAGIRLSYRVLIDQYAAQSDYWHVVIDAENGAVLAQDNMVLKCDFGAPTHHQHDYANGCAQHAQEDTPISERFFNRSFSAPAQEMVEDSRYNVFPFGEESPIHGERIIEKSPAHPVASPFGWHDTNGIEGAEFTITRGNNVWSYPDRNADNSPDNDVVADGGDSLVFDFFYAPLVPADTLLQAAMAQTFYYTNKLHDWLYMAGFNEEAGNFQRRNYTEEGDDRDEVLVEVQDAAFVLNDPTQRNNANFFTPQDGNNGVMQMYLWVRNELEGLHPASITGNYAVGAASFGPPLPPAPLVAQVAIAEPALACDAVTNDLTGKIALITRGDCNFSQKVFNAQEAGAVAAIICNDARQGEERGGLVSMGDGNPELDKRIPSAFITFESCVELRNRVAAGDSVSVRLQGLVADGDFDNGIVAHELGHGVSNRLVGGPNAANCLFNDEQMGEGWSDFFSLAASPQTNVDNPDGTEPRGIGNYALQAGINDRGIRNFPYSTDLAVNPQTYDDIIFSGTAPHPLGEIWNATLWDLYWALSNEIGFNADLIDGDGGNNYAVQLVLEGMKFTKCRPGMIDGRDGILAADRDLTGGTYQCLIWEVFARRGIGFSAFQGSGDNRTDGVEAFDIDPACAGIVLLTKEVDQTAVNAGEGVTFTLKVANFREGLTENVVITDVIPDGMTL